MFRLVAETPFCCLRITDFLFMRIQGHNTLEHCMAHQCLPLRRKFIKCSINKPALSLLMKHLVIGQH